VKISRLSHLLITVIATAACLTSSATSARADGATVRHVAGRIPVQGLGREMSADRPTKSNSQRRIGHVNSKANLWKLQAALPGAVIHDISFLNAKIGYAAAEAGQVWKTTDGGAHWKEVLNLSDPWYWYGVKALNTKDVVISGFYDSSTLEGIIRWSHDGGATWRMILF
jgi:hypothetical protein